MSKVVADKWQTLGFKRKPFIDLSRTKPFLTSKQRQQLTLLEELVREGGHLLLLLGVSGVGKSTFLNVFKKNLALPTPQQAVIGLCEMQGDVSVNTLMIKGLLAKHLAITDGVHTDTFMQSLKARLTQMAQSNERFLLIIDDAHHLPAETVRFILDLMSDLDETAHSLNILLAGRMQLEHLFASSGASDWSTGSSFTLVLEPLNEAEIGNYIKHGLRQAGYKGVMPFSKSQFVDLSVNSKGILARLVVMAVDILETKARDKAPQRSWVIPHKAAWITACAMAIVGVGLIWNLSSPTPTTIPSDDTKVVTVEKQGAWVKTITKPVDTAANDIAPKIQIQDDTSVPSQPQTLGTVPVTKEITPAVSVANTTLVTKNSSAVASIANTASVTKNSSAVPSMANTNSVTENNAEVAPVTNNTILASNSVTNTQKVNAAPTTSKGVAINTPLVNESPVATQTAPPTTAMSQDVPIMTHIPNDNELRSSAEPVKAAPVAPKTPSSKTPVSPDNAAPAKTSAAKTAFKAQGYTIQVAGGYDLKTLQKTVCQLWTAKSVANCRSALPTNLYYLRTLKDDKDWYIATVGQYANSAEAAKQLHQLPPSVQKNTPWARSFAQIPNATVVE